MRKRIIGILSVLVCLCMVCALHSITLRAEETKYNLWVGGVEVTSENKDNITGPGINCGEGGKVSYEPTSKTLTLNNVNITGIYSFRNGLGTDSAGIYYADDDSNASLNINLIGTNAIYGHLGTSDISSYGIYNDSFGRNLTFTGNGSLTIEAGDAISGDEYNSWSVGIYSHRYVIIGADCTITATSGAANTSAAIYNYNRLTATHSKVTAGASAETAREVDITSDDFDSRYYKYMKIEPASVQSVTAINVTGVMAPVIGQAPDFSTPSFNSTPDNAVTVEDNINFRWLKISKDSYTGTSDDIWTPMTSDDTFEADYYYRYGVEFREKVGYKIPANVTGTINGSACTVIAASENYPVMLRTVFGPLTADHTHNLTLVPETPATCTTTGNMAYYTCDGCDKWFSDSAGTTEITVHSSVVIEVKHNPVLVKAEEATAAKEGNIKYYHCENCGKDYYDEAGTEEIATKEAIVIRKLAPKIIDGNNAKLDKFSKEPVSFRSDAAFADFIRVEVDGKELVKNKDYTLKEGSIIATLTPEFTATLTAGEHTLGIVSVSGTALASFTVTADSVSDTVSDSSAVDNSEKSPKTGENGDIIFRSFILVISLAALCITGLNLKSKNNN